MSDSAGIWRAELCFLRSLSLSHNSTFDLMAPKAFRTTQYNMAHFQIIPHTLAKLLRVYLRPLLAVHSVPSYSAENGRLR